MPRLRKWGFVDAVISLLLSFLTTMTVPAARSNSTEVGWGGTGGGRWQEGLQEYA